MIVDLVREYWNSRPCNIGHSSAEVGTPQYFAEVEQRKYFVEPHIPAFAEFDKWKGKKVLELGCGIGTDAVQFARAGAIYTGVDLSWKSIQLAMRRFDNDGLKGTFLVGNMETLYSFVPIEVYDLVYAFGSIHHCQNPNEAVYQVLRYMSPASEFRLMLYATDSWKRAMINAGLEQCEAGGGCPVVHTYTNALARLLLYHFNIISITQDHIFPYNVEKYKQHQYEKLPWFEAMPPDVFRALEKSLGWHLLIKCRKDPTL